MTRIVGTLHVDTSAMQPMVLSFATLGEALSEADGEFEVETTSDGVAFEGALIATIHVGDFRYAEQRMIAPLYVTPTFHLAMFAAEVCRRVPGVKVKWVGPWPHFSANDGDDQFEDEPDPTRPEMVPA
jgi:hypothetical protein